MGADLEVQEQLDEVFVWKTGHPGREGCGGGEKKFNLIIATLCLPTILLDASGRCRSRESRFGLKHLDFRGLGSSGPLSFRFPI